MNREESQLERMNAYVGCGPHHDADVLIMGNEEGTGGYPHEIEAHSIARFLLYGKSEEHVNQILERYKSCEMDYKQIPLDDQYTYHFGDSWKNGFWEPNALDGVEKIRKIILARDGDIPKKSDTFSTFLMHSARICYGLTTDHDTPIEKWFQPKGNNNSKSSEIYTEIKDYAMDNLFSTDHPGKLRTALLDWRPLPRPTQEKWPTLYQFLGTTDKEYIKAYCFKKTTLDMAYVSEFAERRLKYLKSTIVQSKAQTLIMTGEVDCKIDILRHMFPEWKFDFTNISTKQRAFYTRIEYKDENKDKHIHVYLLPFFNYLSLQDLCRIVKNYIVPDFHGMPRPAMDSPVYLPEIKVKKSIERIKKSALISTVTLPEWVHHLKEGDRLRTNNLHAVLSQRNRDLLFEGITNTNRIAVRLLDKRTGKPCKKIYDDFGAYKVEWIVPPTDL